jgi:hypothetical protein
MPKKDRYRSGWHPTVVIEIEENIPQIREIRPKFFGGLFYETSFAYSANAPDIDDRFFGPSVPLWVDSRQPLKKNFAED